MIELVAFLLYRDFLSIDFYILNISLHCSCHPWLPLVATSSGQRHTTVSSSSSDADSRSDSDDAVDPVAENAVKLWWVGATTTDDIIAQV